MPPSVKVTPTPGTRATAAKLKRVDAMAPFRRRLRTATEPIVPAVKRSARSLPSTHSRYKAKERGGSLRSAVANSIQRKLSLTRKTVMVVIKQVPRGGKSNLATVLEGMLLWKHPTYGHAPEVVQDPHPFFYETIDKVVPAIDREVNKVLQELDRML